MISKSQKPMQVKGYKQELSSSKPFVEEKIEASLSNFLKKEMNSFRKRLERQQFQNRPSFSEMSMIKHAQKSSVYSSDLKSILGDRSVDQQGFESHLHENIQHNDKESGQGGPREQRSKLRNRRDERQGNMTKKVPIQIEQTIIQKEDSKKVEEPTFKKGNKQSQVPSCVPQQKERNISMQPPKSSNQPVKVIKNQPQQKQEGKKNDIVIIPDKNKKEQTEKDIKETQKQTKTKDQNEEVQIEDGPSYYDIIKKQEESYLKSQEMSVMKSDSSPQQSKLSVESQKEVDKSQEKKDLEQREQKEEIKKADQGFNSDKKEKNKSEEKENDINSDRKEETKPEQKEEDCGINTDRKEQLNSEVLDNPYIEVTPQKIESKEMCSKVKQQLKQQIDISEDKKVEDKQTIPIESKPKDPSQKVEVKDQIQPLQIKEIVQEEKPSQNQPEIEGGQIEECTFNTCQDVSSFNNEFYSFTNNNEPQQPDINIEPEQPSSPEKIITEQIQSSNSLKQEQEDQTLQSRIDQLMESFYTIVNEEYICDNCQQTLEENTTIKQENQELKRKVSQLTQSSDKLKKHSFDLQMKVQDLQKKLKEMEEKNQDFGQKKRGSVNGLQRKYSSENRTETVKNENGVTKGYNTEQKTQRPFVDPDLEDSQKNSSEMEQQEREKEQDKLKNDSNEVKVKSSLESDDE